MSTTLPLLEGPGDAELISAVRGGDVDAYGELFSRHVDAARRLARQLVSAGDADDLVSEAFAKVLVVLQRGGGPDLAFRAYLLTAVRRLHVDKVRAGARLHTTDDLTPFDPGIPFRDTAVEGFENAAAARAFASLPERWQMVLWHTEVEGQRPAEVAPLLGISANSVSALAYRAREGLRQAFLGMHVQDVDDDACAWTHRNLGPYLRGGVSRRDAARVEQHLGDCRRCTAIHLELTEVNANLAGILAPLLLGGLAAAYVGSAGGVALKGALLLALDRVRDLVSAHAPATAAAGVAATAVVGGSLLVGLDPDPTPPSAAPPAGNVAEEPSPREVDRSDPRRAGDGRRATDRGSRPAAPGATGPADPLSTLPVTAPPSAPPAPGPAPSSPAPPPPSGSGPSSDPAPEPAPAAGHDARVTASASSRGGGAHAVSVAVSGLADGARGTLDIRSEGVAVAVVGDPRCDLLALGSATCTFSGPSATFDLTAAGTPLEPASLVFTVTVDGADPDPRNNRTEVTLTP